MQLFRLHPKFYQVTKIDETEYSPETYERLEKIKLFNSLQAEGCSLITRCSALKVSRTTLYRWKQNYRKRGLPGLENESTRPRTVRRSEWKPSIIQQILSLRKQNPLYGKAKIAVLLKRDNHITISTSTVGRILVYLIKRKQILPASFYYARKRIRPRMFNDHAQRWKKDMKAQQPGDLVQIDHMSVCLTSGFRVKHFQAICPITKIVVEQAYSRATSHVARQFLEHVIASLPFPLRSVQVDGGSEFMKEFEQICKELAILLYVLPPKSPEYNGNVERANGSARYEFYALYSGQLTLFLLRKELQNYVQKYNTYRPHQALQYQTPLQHYISLSKGGPNYSHM